MLVRFADNELVEGMAVDLDLDRPDFELRFRDQTNNRVAIVPLPAVKSIRIDRRPLEEWSADWPLQKIAVHFQDGEVLKGLLGSPADRRAHGILLTLVTPARDEVETIGLPYPGVKAVYFLKSWDGRPPDARLEDAEPSWHRPETPLVNLLGEITSLDSLRRTGGIEDGDFERRRQDVLRRI